MLVSILSIYRVDNRVSTIYIKKDEIIEKLTFGENNRIYSNVTNVSVSVGICKKIKEEGIL